MRMRQYQQLIVVISLEMGLIERNEYKNESCVHYHTCRLSCVPGRLTSNRTVDAALVVNAADRVQRQGCRGPEVAPAHPKPAPPCAVCWLLSSLL